MNVTVVGTAWNDGLSHPLRPPHSQQGQGDQNKKDEKTKKKKFEPRPAVRYVRACMCAQPSHDRIKSLCIVCDS